jgi:hypothetical protein
LHEAPPRHGRARPEPALRPVEVDKTEITWRSKNDHATGGGASDDRKILIVGAVEVQDLRLGRIRLSTMPDDSAASLSAFAVSNFAPDASAQTGGLVPYFGSPDITHDPPAVGETDADKVHRRVHRIFADLKVSGLSVYHGLRRKHLQSYLDEFAFRFNRRRDQQAAFPSLLRFAAAHRPVTYDMLV